MRKSHTVRGMMSQRHGAPVVFTAEQIDAAYPGRVFVPNQARIAPVEPAADLAPIRVHVAFIDDGMVDGVTVPVFARCVRDAIELARRYVRRAHGAVDICDATVLPA